MVEDLPNQKSLVGFYLSEFRLSNPDKTSLQMDEVDCFEEINTAELGSVGKMYRADSPCSEYIAEKDETASVYLWTDGISGKNTTASRSIFKRSVFLILLGIVLGIVLSLIAMKAVGSKKSTPVSEELKGTVSVKIADPKGFINGSYPIYSGNPISINDTYW